MDNRLRSDLGSQDLLNKVAAAECIEARSQLYRCFALAFTHPGDDFLECLFDGEYLRTLLELGDGLPYPTPFENSHEALIPPGTRKQDIGIFFTTCFEAGSQAVSLRESGYSTLAEKALLEELFRFYQFFGLDIAKRGLPELPDTLSVELEFLHYLTYLEANSVRASGERRNTVALQRAQRDFVDIHPGSWIQPFAARLSDVVDGEIYARLAELLSCFVRSEMRHSRTGSHPA